ncbi:MAG TPA: phytoene desaturase [Bacteroidetes bacterium]|nr:phytoene desaturase [Bacteroidota bacterium]
MKEVIVIGSGFAGLSAACFLAKEGYHVRVLEKNDSPGGRCRVWEQDGFRFDMGPSWYWMPDVFDHFFASFGKKTSDYYELMRLDPSYRVFFPEEIWDIPSGTDAFGDLLEIREKGAKKQLDLFLEEAKYKYEVGMGSLVFKPGRSVLEFANWRVIRSVFRLDLFKSISVHLRRFFRDKKILNLLEFPVLFLGAKPQQTPALYSLMNYADIALGTWYPKKGMYEIVSGMYKLAMELGVEFDFNAEVTGLSIRNNQVTRVETNKGFYVADIVVGGADYQHIESKLLPEAFRNYSETYWETRTMAPSSLLFYLGVNKKISGLLHHNLFFDTDFDAHAEAIYDTPKWPDKPLFYASCPSLTDPTLAPEGMENLFILIPLAPGLKDDEVTREKCYHLVMERLEKRVGADIRTSVVVKRSYAMMDFVTDYHSYKGNAYGLANTLRQTAILKPSIKNKKLNNLYYTGQLTVPGPGVPPSLISGEVVSREISREHPISKP